METEKERTESFPNLDVAPPFTLVVKPVHTGHIRRLVVPSKEEKVLRVLDFIAKELSNIVHATLDKQTSKATGTKRGGRTKRIVSKLCLPLST